jgi:aspartate/methionine/tyrosine aminotransferase
MLADRIQRIGLSPTLKISAKAKAMRAEGIDVIDLSVGEPDFPTPDNIKQAGKKAIDDNFTKYTANDGIIALRKAIAKKLKEENGLEYETDEIIVSAGAKNCLFNLCVALFNKGDEAIIPAPYWVSYPAMVELAKGVPVYVQTKEENGFRITPKELTAAISPSTKAIFLNNPCNPTGAAYTKDDLLELGKIILDEGIMVIADEIYEKLIYGGYSFTSFAALSKKLKEQTIVINGLSKAFSMTGWRLGYAAGPKEIIMGMSKVQSHNTSNACSISQMAAVEALNGPQHEVKRMVSEFQIRRNYMIDRLRSMPGVSCYEPRGAFYLFPNVKSYFSKEFDGTQIRNSYGMAYYLLKEAKVAVVPGEAFGTEGYIRLSYATSMENIMKAMDRISNALAKLQPTREAKAVALNNTITQRKEFVETETHVGPELRDALVAEAATHVDHQGYYEWNANILGVVIQLRTNLAHLYDFWMENWYPGQLESDLEPHGIIYAVGWIPGREPRAYYDANTRTAVFFKSAYYAQLRSLAIGMTDDIISRMSNTYSVRGLGLDFDGNGLMLIAPKGTGKATFFANLLRHPKSKLLTDDVAFVRLTTNQAIADVPERKLYMQTNFVEKFPDFAPMFDKSKCENVVTSRDQCVNGPCQRLDNCRLDKGSPFCYEASPISRAMLDPYWIGGTAKHTKRSNLKWIILLKDDPVSPVVSHPSVGEAVRFCEEGLTQSGALRSEPFFNPHLLVNTTDRTDARRRFYERLFELAKPIFINVGAATNDEVQKQINKIIGI